MTRSTSFKSVTVLLVALFANLSPAFGACTKEVCGPIGPPLGGCEQLLQNNLFDDTSCSAWQSTGGYVFLRTNGSDKYYDIYARTTTLYQTSLTAPYPNFEAIFDVEVIYPANAGTERLNVEIRDASTGSLLETIDVWYPTISSGMKSYDGIEGGWTGERNVKLQFRLVPGNAPGDTYFRIKSAYLWSVEN